MLNISPSMSPIIFLLKYVVIFAVYLSRYSLRQLQLLLSKPAELEERLDFCSKLAPLNKCKNNLQI